MNNNGMTMPKTYIPPIANAPKKVGERNVSVSMPIRTGAQQALVIPEKIPRVKTESGSVLLVPYCGSCGIGNFIPRNVITADTSIIVPPI